MMTAGGGGGEEEGVVDAQSGIDSEMYTKLGKLSRRGISIRVEERGAGGERKKERKKEGCNTGGQAEEQ